MTDLDKLARELLAGQYDCDLPGSEIAARLRGEFSGQLRVADLVALAAIRAALLAAPPGYVLVPAGGATDAMRAAWDSAPDNEDDDISFHGAYRAMVAAAPEAR